ncbi:uncharacterized protein LOC125202415 [Salvia hispanica]|uniref:uncharacterized protein LOC125202415 n=1 Tax=Salvia hispanica TaxID=49212 RepID=UPI002009D6B2|nr:uncharacterized protein LOC125202415 [Salvia hispanica]XP_047956766.1 uncharacterized protein LOC125202415 [Salvia hispanica]XP_047956767.1 uncharacterized protein LOC125202415 [Salvia hispanica]
MAMMLLSCTAAAGAYHMGYLSRNHAILPDAPGFCGSPMEKRINSMAFFFCYLTFLQWGTWPNIVGLELLCVAVFVLVEMARPVSKVFMLYYYSIPAIAAVHCHGWDLFYLDWPMLTVPVTLFLIGWRITMLRIAGPALAQP